VLVCPRCTTDRYEVFNDNQVRISHPRYRYPPGYVQKGQGRLPKEVFRAYAVKAALRGVKRTKRRLR